MIYQILDENSIEKYANKIESELETFYEHISKWKYWSSEQSSSWTNSVFRSINTISNIIGNNTNIYNRANSNLRKAYNNGIKIASAKSSINMAKLDNGKILKEFNNLKIILNKDIAKDWLLLYSRDDTSDKYVMNGYINDYNKKK